MSETLEQIVTRVEGEMAEWPPHTVSNLEFARRLVATLGAQEPVAAMSELTGRAYTAADGPNWIALPIKLYAAPVVKEGWQMVPKNETPEMHNAIMSILYAGVTRTNTQQLLDAYLAAAPEYKP